MSEDDILYVEALVMIKHSQDASESYLQRRLVISYDIAKQILDLMEIKGKIGPHCGSHPREVFI